MIFVFLLEAISIICAFVLILGTKREQLHRIVRLVIFAFEVLGILALGFFPAAAVRGT